MFIVVESGATKTAWRAIGDDGSIRAVETAGLSPTCLDVEHTQDIIRQAIPQLNPEGRLINEIFFYGAGLVSPESCAPIEDMLQMWCPTAAVHFYSDILWRRNRHSGYHGYRIKQLSVRKRSGHKKHPSGRLHTRRRGQRSGFGTSIPCRPD